MAQTSSPKVSEIIQEMSNIFAIPLSAADKLVHDALNNGNFVVALPFSPDASLLQVESSSSGSPSFAAPGASQTIISKSNTKAGTSITAGTGLQMHSVTASKTFYMTALSVRGAVTGQSFDVRDSATVSGTPIIAGQCGNNADGWEQTFPTPIAFTTGAFLDVASTGTMWYSISGFEQ